MIPFARFAHDWPEAGGRFYNVVDPENRTSYNGSTISLKTVDRLCLPIIENADDEDSLIRIFNLSESCLKENLCKV